MIIGCRICYVVMINTCTLPLCCPSGIWMQDCKQTQVIYMYVVLDLFCLLSASSQSFSTGDLIHAEKEDTCSRTLDDSSISTGIDPYSEVTLNKQLFRPCAAEWEGSVTETQFHSRSQLLATLNSHLYSFIFLGSVPTSQIPLTHSPVLTSMANRDRENVRSKIYPCMC